MSAKLMGAVFELQLDRDEFPVMMALADHAADDGTSVYPSIAFLAWKVNQSERTIQRVLRKLEGRGLIEPVTGERGGRGITREFVIHIANGVRKSPFEGRKGGKASPYREPKSVNVSPIPTEKGDKRDMKRVTNLHPTIEELEPPVEPSVAAARELSPTERKVVARIKQVRGMAAVADAEVADHLAEVLTDLPPVTDQTLLAESLKFRDYWNERRASQGDGKRWRGWKVAMTNWFRNVRDPAPTYRNGNGRHEERPEPRRKLKVMPDGSELWLDY